MTAARAGRKVLLVSRRPNLGWEITAALAIPTIGIGAGPDCDGQILVLHDMLGLNDRHLPKFVKQYARLADAAREVDCVTLIDLYAEYPTFEIDVDREQNQQQQFEQLAQQQQQRQGSKSRQPWQQVWENEEQIVPLAHLMQNGGGGISLHV